MGKEVVLSKELILDKVKFEVLIGLVELEKESYIKRICLMEERGEVLSQGDQIYLETQIVIISELLINKLYKYYQQVPVILKWDDVEQLLYIVGKKNGEIINTLVEDPNIVDGNYLGLLLSVLMEVQDSLYSLELSQFNRGKFDGYKEFLK